MTPDDPPGRHPPDAPTSPESLLSVRNLVTAMLIVALFVANLSSLRTFVVAVVAMVGLWIWEIAITATANGTQINPYPAFLALLASAAGAYRWGFEGFAAATLVAVVAALAWAVLRPSQRDLAMVASTALAGLLAGLCAGSLTLLRLRWDLEVNAWLLVIAVALAAAVVARRLQHRIPLLDANIAALTGAAVAGLLAGSASELSVSTTFVASVAAAGGLVAGNTAGSLLRWGRISLLTPAPGNLTLVDGPIVAAPVFWLTMVILTA